MEDEQINDTIAGIEYKTNTKLLELIKAEKDKLQLPDHYGLSMDFMYVNMHSSYNT